MSSIGNLLFMLYVFFNITALGSLTNQVGTLTNTVAHMSVMIMEQRKATRALNTKLARAQRANTTLR